MKIDGSPIDSLMMQIMILNKTSKCTSHRRKDTMKFREERNEIESNRTIQKILKIRKWFFEGMINTNKKKIIAKMA